MQVEVNPAEGGNARLNITLTPDEVNEAIDATYRRLSPRVKIPGFRPGKAPRAMLLRSYGEESFYHEATDQAVRTWYPKALDESGVEALDAGRLDLEDDHDHLQPDESFSFAAEVPTKPEINLPEYGLIKIPAPSTTVSDAEVDKLIDGLRMAAAKLEPVPARAAELGNVVRMNIRARSEGEEVLARDDFQFELRDVEADAEGDFPGLSKELTDARPGDIREIVLHLPTDYREPGLAGHAMSLNIVVKEILRKVPPDLTDEWVQGVSKTAKTVPELRTRVRQNLEHEKTDEAINTVATEVVDSLIARANPPAPEPLVADEQDRLFREQRRYLERSGVKMEQFLIAAKRSETEYRNELKPAAEKRVKRDLILDAVAKAEGLEPDQEAVDEEVEEMSEAIARSEADFERLALSKRLHETVAGDMRRRMALSKLVETTSGLKPWKPAEEGDVDATEEAPAVVSD
jgi:trigger factor